jgi:hypothetical protein
MCKLPCPPPSPEAAVSPSKTIDRVRCADFRLLTGASEFNGILSYLDLAHANWEKNRVTLGNNSVIGALQESGCGLFHRYQGVSSSVEVRE